MGLFSLLFGKKSKKEKEIVRGGGHTYRENELRARNAEEFFALVDGNFAENEIEKDVPVVKVNPAFTESGLRPYDRVIYVGGKPKAAIMYTPHNRDNNRAYLGAKEACEKAGVVFLNFYEHMLNAHDYVKTRISEALK